MTAPTPAPVGPTRAGPARPPPDPSRLPRGWHDEPMPPPPAAGPRRRALPLALLVLLVVLTSLTGCARVRTALAVQPDDTVRGEIVVATPETGPEDTGPAITLPPSLQAADMDVTTYRQEGYTGSLLRFSGLSFAEVGELVQVAGPAGQQVRFELRRAGNRVVVAGEVDLTTVSVDRADFQLKISFPGQVLDSNGDADSGLVSWTFEAGRVGEIDAVVAFDDPNAPSPVNWTLGLAVVVAAAAGVVVMLARRTRNPPIR